MYFHKPPGICHNRPMLYKFKSKAGADVIMLEPHGRQILEIIGKSPAPQGILRGPELSAALLALQQAISAQEDLAAQARQQAATDDHHPEPPEQITLRQRAAPFMTLLQRCEKNRSDLVWGV